MEKFGLFDLIDKFNAVANGKNDFAKRKTEQQDSQGDSKIGNGNPTAPLQNKLIDPQIFPPAQYIMNAKLRDFNKKHDEFSRRVK